MPDGARCAIFVGRSILDKLVYRPSRRAQWPHLCVLKCVHTHPPPVAKRTLLISFSPATGQAGRARMTRVVKCYWLFCSACECVFVRLSAMAPSGFAGAVIPRGISTRRLCSAFACCPSIISHFPSDISKLNYKSDRTMPAAEHVHNVHRRLRPRVVRVRAISARTHSANTHVSRHTSASARTYKIRERV